MSNITAHPQLLWRMCRLRTCQRRCKGSARGGCATCTPCVVSASSAPAERRWGESSLPCRWVSDLATNAAACEDSRVLFLTKHVCASPGSYPRSPACEGAERCMFAEVVLSTRYSLRGPWVFLTKHVCALSVSDPRSSVCGSTEHSCSQRWCCRQQRTSGAPLARKICVVRRVLDGCAPRPGVRMCTHMCAAKRSVGIFSLLQVSC